MSPLDALSALSGIQMPSAGASAAANPYGPPGSIPIGLTAPVGEGFSQNLQGIHQAQGIEGLQGTQATAAIAPTGGASPTTWGHMVQQMVMDVNSKQQNANALVNDVLKGGPTPVHQAMIATEEADLSFQFLAQVRNKVIDAYNQVMQMQV